MTDEEFKDLNPGDIVRSKAWGMDYVVVANEGGRVRLTRPVSAEAVHPPEWCVVRKAEGTKDA